MKNCREALHHRVLSFPFPSTWPGSHGGVWSHVIHHSVMEFPSPIYPRLALGTCAGSSQLKKWKAKWMLQNDFFINDIDIWVTLYNYVQELQCYCVHTRGYNCWHVNMMHTEKLLVTKPNHNTERGKGLLKGPVLGRVARGSSPERYSTK